MKKYIRIKFSDIDFFDFRIGGPGLGNLLFVWARAVVYAEKFNLKILSPNWKTFKIGTYLRKEKDKRNYKNIFKNDGIKGLKKYIIQLCSNKFIQNSKLRSILKLPKVLIFSGMKNQMNDIINDYTFVRSKLYSILSNETIDLIRENKPRCVGVHIRFGDFKNENENELRAGKTNTRIPIEWYVNIISKLKNKFGNHIEFMIFSDGSKEELHEILRIKNVYFSYNGNAISDLIVLSKSKIIVASNSTFSLWASYLGRCHTIWFPGTKRFNLFGKKDNCIEFELDYDKSLPNNLELP